jgi:hypothetical protein
MTTAFFCRVRWLADLDTRYLFPIQVSQSSWACAEPDFLGPEDFVVATVFCRKELRRDCAYDK